MIPAKKNAFWNRLWHGWLVLTLTRRFAAVRVRGLGNLQSLSKTRPTIAFSNHTNWWDAPLVFSLAGAARHKNFYCMMEEVLLRRQRFLTRLGAFSVDLENPLRAAAAIRYAVRLLQNGASLIWVFPQGAITSPYVRPETKPGVQFLAAQAAAAQMLPVAFRYEFFSQAKPEALIEIGEPFPAAESNDERLSHEIRRLNEKLERAVELGELTGFEEVSGLRTLPGFSRARPA